MAIGDVTFVKGQGGLGRPLPGEDFISGLVLYGSYPSGFSSTVPVRQFFSVADAENAGIVDTYVDSATTQATVPITISTVGATGDTVTFIVKEIPSFANGLSVDNPVSLGTYTLTSGDHADATGDALANSLAAFITNGLYLHGYTATASGSSNVVTLHCPKRLGIYVPTVTYNRTGNTFVANAGSATAGTASALAVWHYHISEYFRLQPKGNLYVGVFASSTNFQEISAVQTFAQGTIRQLAVYKNGSFATGDLSLINTEIVTNNDNKHKPMSALYAGDLAHLTDLTTDLNSLSANKVSAIVSQDGGALGAYLYHYFGKSITTLGAALGAVSLASVHESIEWRSKFNISNGYECDTPAFADSTLVSTVSQNQLDQLDAYRYVFLIKNIGFSGSYFNSSHTAVSVTSDYAYIENNRTIDKAIRGVYSSLLPALGAPIVLNGDGTLTDESISYFTSLAELNLREMARNTELSDFAVIINSTQNVLSTNTLVVAVELLPVGVARAITVNIGFVVAIS